MRLYARAQFVQAEGLYDIVVPADPETGNFIRIVHARSQKEYGTAHMVPDPLADFQPVHIRHVDVQQDHIRLQAQLLQRLRARKGGQHVVAAHLKIIAQHVHDIKFIVHYQEFLTHTYPPNPFSMPTMEFFPRIVYSMRLKYQSFINARGLFAPFLGTGPTKCCAAAACQPNADTRRWIG